MPIINVQFIKDVVATPEQKHELIVRLTDTFVDVLGEVVRPFVYCLIEETPQMEWGIAGVPMPDLAYLTGDKHAGVIDRANTLMREAIASMQSGDAAAAAQGAQPAEANARADKLWRGETDQLSMTAQPAEANARADKLWRGEIESVGQSSGARAASHAAEHRALFERWFEELWNKKNYAIAYELVDPDFTAHGAGGQDIKQGPDGVVGMVKAWHGAMPDGRMTLDDIITEGELSTIRMTWRGTHTGQFGDIPASGNAIEVTSTGIDRVVDGKITEGWGELNMLGMLQQMGAIPTPEADSAAEDVQDRAARNKASVLRMYEETNKGNIDVIFEVLAPEFVSYGGAGFEDIHGPQAFIEFYQSFATAFPDLQFEVQHIAADGDLVIARGIQTATHLGDFMGMAPPTGKKVVWPGTATFRFNDEGRAVERWLDLDNLDLLQQLGAIPAFDGNAEATGGNGRSSLSSDEADRVWRGEVPMRNGSAKAHAAEHRALFERWFEELWNKKNYAIAYELVDPDFTAHGAGGQDIKQGPDGVVGMVKAWHGAMPDGRMTLDDIITEGELSTIRMTWRGTHTGQFGDIPASGNAIEVTSTGIDRVVNGKITEGWGELNMLGMLQQMGAIPMPEAPQGRGDRSSGADADDDKSVRRRNRRTARSFFKAVNGPAPTELQGLVAPDFTFHGGPSGDGDLTSLVSFLETRRRAIPDYQAQAEYVVSEGNRVAVRSNNGGTHDGSFMGEEPSGKKIAFSELTIFAFDDAGKITDIWHDVDTVSMLMQAGVIPVPASAQTA